MDHPNFFDLINNNWNGPPIYGCPLFILKAKLKKMKFVIKDCNLNVYGNISTRVGNATENLQSIQLELDSNGHSDLLDNREVKTQAN